MAEAYIYYRNIKTKPTVDNPKPSKCLTSIILNTRLDDAGTLENFVKLPKSLKILIKMHKIFSDQGSLVGFTHLVHSERIVF